MRSDTELSNSEIVLECLGVLWTPGGEALKLQMNLNIRSVEDIPIAADRAGIAVCYVDLPEKVSGFADVIGGKPHIVVNRAKSREHQQYTVAHELGHQVLHVSAEGRASQLGLLTKELVEFQAHMFAATMVLGVTNDKDREDVLRQNPESRLFPAISFFMTVALLLVALLGYLWSRLSPRQLSGSAASE